MLKNLLFRIIVLVPALMLLAACTAREPLKPGVIPESGQIPTVKVDLDPTQVPNPYHTIVGFDFVKPFVAENVLLEEPRSDVVIIDSRPKRPRYDRGHIPTAISIPYSEFDALTHKLPADRSTLLIFYCGGLHCPLSHDSAWKAEQLGYGNIAVYAQGDPEWVKKGYRVWTIEDITQAILDETKTEPSALPDTGIKQGRFEGSIDNDFFVQLMAANPQSIQLIDVRSPAEYAAGHIPSAENMTVDQLEGDIDSFADEKPIVFICSTGARSGEAYYLFLDKRPDLKSVYYVDATVTYFPDGSFTIE